MTNKAITVENLVKEYQGTTAVDGISFEIEQGEIVALLGPNGAGKTTVLRSMLGLVVPTEGEIGIFGESIDGSRNSIYEKVGAVLEGARNCYWRFTVRENLEYFVGLQGEFYWREQEKIDAILQSLSLSDLADRTVNTLSRGQKQKVAIGCALARDTPALLLDEPTLGLDVEASQVLRTELERQASKENKAIVVTSHNMDMIERVCDRVIVVSEGEIIERGPVESLINVFSKDTYTITVSGVNTSGVKKALEREFSILDSNRYGDQLQIQLVLEEQRITEVIDRVHQCNAKINDITKQQPSLEDVFLKIVKSEKKEIVETVGDH